jgi:metal-sulfur cluster biosynthetic enzyme
VATPDVAAAPTTASLPTKDQIINVLRECYDPEIPVNIVDLGLIYLLDIAPDGRVTCNMTLTAVGCPVSGWMQEQVQSKIQSVPGVKEASVNIVFEPPWDPTKLTPEGREQLLAMGFPV